MKEEILYRNVLEDDAFEVLRVDTSHYNKNSDEPLSIYFIRDCCRMFNSTFFVALIEGKIVGFCIGLSSKSEEYGWISALTILDIHRKKGIATNLIKSVLDSFRNLNCNRVGLTAIPDSEAYKLYKKINFKEIKLVQNYYGEKEHRLLMEICI